jgi:hypothetical protein
MKAEDIVYGQWYWPKSEIGWGGYSPIEAHPRRCWETSSGRVKWEIFGEWRWMKRRCSLSEFADSVEAPLSPNALAILRDSI